MSEFAQDHLSRSQSRMPGGWKYAPGIFLIVFLAIGLPFSLLPAASRTLPHGKAVMTGEWTHSFEGNLDQHLPSRDLGVRTWANFNYLLFREGRPGVLVGDKGWLYTTEEFAVQPGAPQERASKIAYIKQVQRQARAQGARLVVAVVPAKARLYPEHLGRYHLPAANLSVYDEFQRQLQAAGIPSADLLADMQRAKVKGSEFLHTDTHWTPYGARVAAQAVARKVNSLWPQLALVHSNFATATGPSKPHQGDLLSYLPVGASLAPAPDSIQQPSTQSTDAEGGLLGDSSIPVTLIGTSYSANETWNFDGALKQALGADVLNLAQEGKGPIIPMREYLASGRLKREPPQLIIWELPERFLGTAYP